MLDYTAQNRGVTEGFGQVPAPTTRNSILSCGYFHQKVAD